MGEIYIIAVSPIHQRQGIGKALMDFANEKIREAGMTMVMVETGGDTGHAPARHAYESFGFESWPAARYFKRL
jgi:GNAT superfamily N-acetyltransferase